MSEKTKPAKVKKAKPAPSAAMLALFAAPATIDLAKAKRMNLPAIIKPGDVPVGGSVSGKLVKVVNSPVSTVKGKLLWLEHESGREFLFPCTGVIRSALAPGIQADDGKLTAALQPHVGKQFVATRLESKHNDTYKKDMFMFDVYVI